MHEPDHFDEVTVLQLLERHGGAEGEALDAYERLVARPGIDEEVRYLVQMILEDEARHHRMFEEMANTLRSVLWEVPMEPRLPAAERRHDPELLAATERILAFERKDAKELRALRRRLRRASLPSVHLLAVEMMLHDTAKHIDMLRYVKERLA